MSIKPYLNNGFTLVELLLITSLIGLLSGFGLTTGKEQIDKSTDSKRKTDVHEIEIDLEGYYNDHGCYPTTNQWSTVTCDQVPQFLSGYVDKPPCDPQTGEPYYYEATDENGEACTGACGDCYGYRLLTGLSRKFDPDIIAAGCDPTSCGIISADNRILNWGIAVGHTVPVPGFIPGNGQDTGHTDKHDCQHSKDPGCENPTETPMTIPTVTPTASPTTTPTPTPTAPDICLPDILPEPTPYPIYPNKPDNYIYSPGSPPIGTPNIPADFSDIIRALEWYKVDNGAYPECSCYGWAELGTCLQAKLAKYTILYPAYIKYFQLSWSDAEKFDFRYITFNNDASGKPQDYCIATKWAWGIQDGIKWNQLCPVSIPDPSYVWLKKSPLTIIKRKPTYANVYPLLPKETGSARDEIRKENLVILRNALENYKQDNGRYPFPSTSRIDMSYNLKTFESYLVPAYLTKWVDDPYATTSEPHSYNVWLSAPDNEGYPTKYCLMAFMDENSNCSQQCTDFPWIYKYGEAFCYYLPNK